MEYRGKKMGYLFQDFKLLDNLTGREIYLIAGSDPRNEEAGEREENPEDHGISGLSRNPG